MCMCIVVLTTGACTDDGPPTIPRASSGVAAQDRFNLDAMAFATIDVPGSTGTFALDVNGDDFVVGRFIASGVTHGFLRDAVGILTTFDVPGASFTVAAGINNGGDIVGMYALPSAPTERHGFILRGGEFTTIDPDGSKFTNALGVNSQGDVVGRYCTSLPCGRAGSGKYHGFVWHDGTITVFDVPNSVETNAWKINARGEIFGGFRYADNVNRFFLLYDGEFTTFDVPGASPAAQDNGGFNERGDIAGVYCAASPCDLTSAVNHGFVLVHGELTTIDVPGAKISDVLGMNSHGSLAGGYVDQSGKNHGFLLKRAD